MKITNQTNSVTLGDTDYPRNLLSFQTKGDYVTIRVVASEEEIIQETIYSEFKNSSDVPYATLAALVADLRSYLFSSQS